MNQKKKKGLKFISVFCYVFSILIITFGFIIILIKNSSLNEFKISDIDLSKYVDDKKMLKNYEKINKNDLEPVLYEDFKLAVENSKYFPTSFVGKLTHYGPDCPLCGGRVGCNGQDVRNGNIYYEDKEYGTLRIVATSTTIPCGSIIRINVHEYDPNGMYAIVLDRGVGDAHVDLLKTSQVAASPVRTINKVVFDIVRYGY